MSPTNDIENHSQLEYHGHHLKSTKKATIKVQQLPCNDLACILVP